MISVISDLRVIAFRAGCGLSLQINEKAACTWQTAFQLEKVFRFDRKRLKGVHRLFRGVHFVLRGCKRQRGCVTVRN
mgnify:CR=1 FL=1